MRPNKRLLLTGRMQGGSRALSSAGGWAAAAARPAVEARSVGPPRLPVPYEGGALWLTLLFRLRSMPLS